MKKGIWGIRKGALSAERLKITPEYRRFDQKNNMIYAGEWNPEYEGLGNAPWLQTRAKLIEKDVSGYNRRDLAFFLGATAVWRSAGFVVNVGDSGGTSWKPIKRVATAGAMSGTLPPWKGDEKENTALLKKMALRFGAGDAGLCLLDRRFVYNSYFDMEKKESFPIRFSDEPGFEDITEPTTLENGVRVIPKEMKYVLVMVYPMEISGIKTAPRLTHLATTQEAYSQIAATTTSMAEFIRGLGYNAIPSSNDTAASIPLAIDAGLGEATRNSKLCHPVYGTCCRISKIITDFPIIPDEPIEFGIRKFCGICKLCAEKCPAKAISMDDDVSDTPYGDFTPSHITQWHMNHAKCRKNWMSLGTNCGICIASCPLNQKNTLAHRLRKSIVAKYPAMNAGVKRAMVNSSERLKSPDEFWNGF